MSQLPPDDLIERLLQRYAPQNYFIGANARCFRAVRQVTLFARKPTIDPTADFHHRYVLILGIGEGTVVVSGARRHLVGRGQALLIPPYTLHRYETVDGVRHPLAFVGFEAERGDDSADTVTLNGLDAGVLSVPAEGWELLRRVDAAFDARPACIPALILQILEILSESTPIEAEPSVRLADWERTLRVAKLARHNPTLSVQELSRACAVSESLLREAILSTVGMPMARFMRQLRLQMSLAMVARRQFTAAADRAGYATVEAYAKAFKSEFGMSPSKYADLALTNRWRIRAKPEL